MTFFLWFIIVWNAFNLIVNVTDKNSEGWARLLSVIIHGGAMSAAGYFLLRGACS